MLFGHSAGTKDRKKLFGDSAQIRKENVTEHLNQVHHLYSTWIKNEPNKKAIYLKALKRLNSCINEASDGRKIKIYIDIFLISFIGAYVARLHYDCHYRYSNNALLAKGFP